jgi:ABC-type bacteriocin/lantibiotic exporter with double-glycine peptidase domain
MQQPIALLLKGLWCHVSRRRRWQLLLLLGLAVVTSFAEVVSLGAVLPFIGILIQPEKVFSSPVLVNVINIFGITSAAGLVLPLTMAFAFASLLACALRLLLLWAGIRFGNAAGADLAIEIYRRTLYQDYSVHIERSSSEIISGITQKVAAATSVLISLVTIITSTALFTAIICMLIAVDPAGSILAMTGFGAAYGIIAFYSHCRLVENSHCIAREQTLIIRALQEGLGSIRDVLLDGTQKVYCNAYRKAILRLQRAVGGNTFISQAPRYAMEAFGMVLIAIIALIMSYRTGGVIAALPTLAMLALGAQRLLPLMQQLFGNWSVVAGSKGSMRDVLNLLDQPLPTFANQSEPEPLKLSQSIVFQEVSFRYSNHTPWVLNDVNLTIPKGAHVGIIGATGSGKSTLLDLMMGLLRPTRGRILVDGNPIDLTNQRAWQRTIAHVPQSIYLTDATITENIAFGIPPGQIDIERVRKAAQQAQIAHFIESRIEGYDAVVGERGVRLSGGQRQRIGIARALYKQASVLIFDEATSALDNDTEQAIMETIEDLNKEITLFMIAHRISTLKKCNLTLIVENGKITVQKF